MPEQVIPRVLIAGTGSGCGKTTVVCGILAGLKQRGRILSAFKCGPDYIDTMFHEKVIGVPSGNLDSFFMDEGILNYLLAVNSAEADFSLIEGVMGYYDGGAMSERYSTYEVALKTKTPVVLVLNCRGVGNSVLAMLNGFLGWKADSQIRGVILNQVSAAYYPLVKELIEQHYGGRIKIFGYLPPLAEHLQLESRHLGLITAGEVENLKGILQALGEVAGKTIDLDGLLQLGQESLPVVFRAPKIPVFSEKAVIGVAYDKAFCFYYRDNLKLLTELGADLVYFSPLTDEKLPPQITGLLLGGGYPELYGQALSGNEAMRQDIFDRLSDGLPCIAECGGFMYLTEALDSLPMVGYLPGGCENKGRLTRFGYVTLTAGEENLLLSKGGILRGHEFHYYDCSKPGDSFTAAKVNGRSWPCVHSSAALYAGYPHLHFYSNLKAVESFYQACLKYKERRV